MRTSAVKAELKSPINSRKGFTLLEVLVSLVLMSVGLVAIFQLFSVNLRGLAASDDYIKAVMVAESKMREALDDDKLTEKSWTESTQDGYRVEGVVTSTAEERTENLQVRLLEVNLTLHWSKDARDKSLTLKAMKAVKKEI